MKKLLVAPGTPWWRVTDGIRPGSKKWYSAKERRKRMKRP